MYFCSSDNFLCISFIRYKDIRVVSCIFVLVIISCAFLLSDIKVLAPSPKVFEEDASKGVWVVSLLATF